MLYSIGFVRVNNIPSKAGRVSGIALQIFRFVLPPKDSQSVFRSMVTLPSRSGAMTASLSEKLNSVSHPPYFGDGESVLTMLYECYNENNPYDNEQIRTDFNELYQQMNGMPLREMDNIVYPVCKLCRNHEKAGFIEGIRLGVLLAQEVAP